MSSAAALAVPAYAQSTDEAAQAEAEAAAVEAESQGADRPDMPPLFFRVEQRRVLEAVRQGIVTNEDFEIEEFAPVLIQEDPILPLETAAEPLVNRERSQQYSFDAYIVNHSTGKTKLWLNGQEIDADEDAEGLERRGLTGDEEGENLRIKDGNLAGSDHFNGSKFRARVGQIIDVNGAVEETLPVIRINKR